MPKTGFLASAAGAIAIASLAWHAPAFAQTAGTAGPFVYDLFSADSVDVDPVEARKLADEARKAQAPGDCPVGRLTVFAGVGDSLFQEALAAARRDAVLAFLNGQGIDASRFFADAKVFGAEGNSTDVQLEYTLPDREPPRLNVTSSPEKGKKVTPNQRIAVKAIANDDANRWQTGIKSIDLLADGGRPFGFQDYSPPQPPCETIPPSRSLDGVYTVPDNPPPIVRLRASAKDFAGNETELWADFPTGDWHGTVRKTARGGGHNHSITIVFAHDVAPDGTIKGRARAHIDTEAGEVPGCTMLWTYEPSDFDITLAGRLVGENFEIELEPQGTVNATLGLAGACSEGQGSAAFPSHLNPAVHGRTKFLVSAQDGASNTATLRAGELPWGVIMTDTITLHQTPQ